MALSDYVTATRRLLHDSSGRVWSTAELNAYVNDGRKRLAVDTHCLRYLDTAVTLTTHTETYSGATLTAKGTRCIDIANFTVLWGSQRVPMIWCPWTKFNALYRPWQVNYSRPCVWSFAGTSPASSTIYVQPVPDQAYTAEVDLFYVPVDLVDDTTVDELAYPFDSPVPYYAAHLAKLQEQSYGEAEELKKQYATKAMEAINSFTRRLPNAYT